MTSISELETADRIEIFKHIAVDELNEVRLDILDLIASKHFQTFTDFCDKVFSEKDKIKNVSCSIIDDELFFDIEYV